MSFANALSCRLGLAVLASISLGACGSSSSDTNTSTLSQTLSYDMTVNGCATGKQTFSDKAGYCAGLKDDARNNFCAKGLREEVYAENCEPKPAAGPTGEAAREVKPATVGGDGKSSGNLRIPTEQFGSSAGSKTLTPTEQAEIEGRSRPALVILRAQAAEQLQVQPTSSGDSMITTLNGKLLIHAMDPDVSDRGLTLIGATARIVIPLLGSCELTVKNFSSTTTVGGKKQIDFTLLGIDPIASANRDGCLVKLSTMAMTGFSVEFDNVRLGGTLSTVSIPKVRLDVSAGIAPALK